MSWDDDWDFDNESAKERLTELYPGVIEIKYLRGFENTCPTAVDRFILEYGDAVHPIGENAMWDIEQYYLPLQGSFLVSEELDLDAGCYFETPEKFGHIEVVRVSPEVLEKVKQGNQIEEVLRFMDARYSGDKYDIAKEKLRAKLA